MSEEQSNYPCKYCYHIAQAHYIFEETSGGWIYDDNVGHEVWEEQPYPRPICEMCNNDCIFEQMNNLEYLQWLYEQQSKEVNNNG